MSSIRGASSSSSMMVASIKSGDQCVLLRAANTNDFSMTQSGHIWLFTHAAVAILKHCAKLLMRADNKSPVSFNDAQHLC